MNDNSILFKIISRENIDYNDVSKEQLMELLRHTATTDNTSGANNEVGLMVFGRQLERTGRIKDYFTVFFNIRSMRLLNERWTNAGGNQILRGVANEVAVAVAGRGIVARMGGDNFFALVKKEAREEFIAFMEELSVEICMEDIKYNTRVRVRMGLYENMPGDTMRICMDNASVALQYIRTSSDKYISEFVPQMKEVDLRAKSYKDDLKYAIQSGAFSVYYQPKVNAEESVICGAEALSRWYRSGRIVPPGEFVPILEKTGAICHLDFYVFEQVCADIRRWIDEGMTPIRVSSNFSKRHLDNADFADRILDILDRYDIDTDMIEIELTEAFDAEDSQALTEFLEIMSSKGIRTSIDDFGSGYSSLKLLKEMKADTVKLDKSIIDDTGIGITENDAIAANMIRMLNDLNLEVVAEGVETKAQVDFLRIAGCNIIQGFYYDKPLSKEEFAKRLSRRKYNK